MKKSLILMIALFVLPMFSVVTAHDNKDTLLNSNNQMIAVNGPQTSDPQDPQQPYPPEPQPPQQPQPQPPESIHPQPPQPNQHHPH